MAGFAALFVGLSTVDYLRSAALIIAFLATAFADKKGDGNVWLLADQISNFAFGLAMVVFPGTLLGYQVIPELNPMHHFIVQLMGFVFLSMGLIWLVSSRDRGSVAAWALARTLGSAIMLQVMLVHHFQRSDAEKTMTKQHRSFGILGAALMTLGHGMCAFRTLGTAVYKTPIQGWNRRNVALLLFLTVLTLDMCVKYGMPELVLEHLSEKYKGDAVVLYMTRATMGVFLSVVFYGFAALISLNEKESTAVLLAGLFAYGCAIVTFVYRQNKYQLMTGCGQNYILGWNIMTVGICVAGTWDWFMGSAKAN